MPDHDPVAFALTEDVGSGDLTSIFFLPEHRQSHARIFAKEPAVVAGTSVAEQVYRTLDPSLEVIITTPDGTPLSPGDTVLRISGSTRSILTGERVALNFIQHLSGIATLTREFVRRTEGTSAKILDTRKTMPGLRRLEKAAVKAGGGQNHRMGLFDGVIVKDNHLLTRPQLEEAIRALKQTHPDVLIELEADSLDQVKTFVQLPGVDRILLDNMSVAELIACVALRRRNLTFEASGGISLDMVEQIAKTGVDYISVGKLTHSARAIDFSLELLDEEIERK